MLILFLLEKKTCFACPQEDIEKPVSLCQLGQGETSVFCRSNVVRAWLTICRQYHVMFFFAKRTRSFNPLMLQGLIEKSGSLKQCVCH